MLMGPLWGTNGHRRSSKNRVLSDGLMLGRWCIWLAAALAPACQRQEWRRHYVAEYSALHALIARGEMPRSARSFLVAFLAACFSNAFYLRFSRQELQRWARGPELVLAGGASLAVVLVAASRGFANTRAVLHGDTGVLLSYAIPIVFALTVGVTLILVRGQAVYALGWRSFGFFAAKVASILALVPLLWLELNPLFRQLSPNTELATLLVALVSRLAFIGAFACALLWSFADQRRRCPECLRLLTLPTTSGSRSSVLDAVTTQYVCENGHGSLTVPESETAPAQQWVKLDDSWQDLFTVH